MEDLLYVEVHSNRNEPAPMYRLYLDTDLLTERDFIWEPGKTWVRERCTVAITEGEHKIWISGPDSQCFELKNAVLNGEPVELAANGVFKK